MWEFITGLVTKPLLKKAASTIAAMIVGAIVAYLIDKGMLDGAGADTLSQNLLSIAAQIIDIIFP